MARGLGFQLPKRWPTQEELEKHAARMLKARAAAGYPSVVLRVPTILDQGNSSACTGFAAVQCAHIATGAPIGSPAFSYYNNRICDGMSEGQVSDDGASPDGVDKALNAFGVCPMANAPFSDDPVAVNAKPHDLAYIAAQRLKCDLSPIIETGSALADAVAYTIAVERKPVLLAIQVTPAYDNASPTNPVADDPSGDSRGLHAICGFSNGESGIGTAGSWGTSFGLGGVVWLSPRFIAANVVYAAAFEVLP